MIWKTRSHLHLDRTASAWLVKRFIDEDARFEFVDWTAIADGSDDYIFGVPGAQLAPHQDGGTTFRSILIREALESDAALDHLERAIAAGVRHATGKPATQDQTLFETSVGVTLDACGLAWSALHSDLDHLAAASPIFDALYAYFQFGDLDNIDLPPTQPERVAALRDLLDSRTSTN